MECETLLLITERGVCCASGILHKRQLVVELLAAILCEHECSTDRTSIPEDRSEGFLAPIGLLNHFGERAA